MVSSFTFYLLASSALPMMKARCALCACVALDIEFGMRADGQLVLFQVRRIALAHSWHPVTEIRVRRQLVYVEQFIRDCSRRLDGILGEIPQAAPAVLHYVGDRVEAEVCLPFDWCADADRLESLQERVRAHVAASPYWARIALLCRIAP